MHTKLLVLDSKPVIQKKNKTFLLVNKTLDAFVAQQYRRSLTASRVRFQINFAELRRVPLLVASRAAIHLFAFADVANCCLSMGKIMFLRLLVEIGSSPLLPARLAANHFAIFAFRLSLLFYCSEPIVGQFPLAFGALCVFAEGSIRCFDSFCDTFFTCNLLR